MHPTCSGPKVKTSCTADVIRYNFGIKDIAKWDETKFRFEFEEKKFSFLSERSIFILSRNLNLLCP